MGLLLLTIAAHIALLRDMREQRNDIKIFDFWFGQGTY